MRRYIGLTAPFVTELLQLPASDNGTVYHHISRDADLMHSHSTFIEQWGHCAV